MSQFIKSVVNQRFKTVYQYLETKNLIKGKSDLAKKLGTYNHVINSILKAERNITLEQLNKLVDLFGLNANYLFGVTDDMFKTDEASNAQIVAGTSRRNNIVLVPQRAMAGYIESVEDPEYSESLPRFSVPNMEGDLVAFEISGDSMSPTIANGDIVICEPMESGDTLRDSNVYIVVTDTVVAKRVYQKKEGDIKYLELISDNQLFRPYRVELSDVRQILRVKSRLTNSGIG